MSIVTCDISVSMDGYSAGVDQSLEQPLGNIDESWLHAWMFDAADENRAEVDAIVDAGAFIMGRNMFGPDRGAWDLDWKGWWGDDPPYHGPVFVLGHREREPVPMEGGTTFHFVTDGIHAALERARDAAQGRDVRVGGGVATIREYLHAGLVDSMHLAISPTLLGRGEALLAGIDLVALGFRCTDRITSPKALHVVLTKETR